MLSARAAAAESVLAYTALADLLDGVPASAWADLPEPQRSAVDQVLMRADNGSATDQRAVAAAFLSVVEYLTDDGPLLVAIDDLQWIDPSSMHVVAFAARRLSGPVGILGSVRTDGGSGGGCMAANAATRCGEPNSIASIGYSRFTRSGVGTPAATVLAPDDGSDT